MPARAVTLTLPEALYDRVRATADASSRSVQDVMTQSIALSLPPLEEDLPPAVRSELAALSLKSDDELSRLADRSMAESRQDRLEELAELNKKRSLSHAEASALAQLMEEAQQVMLSKAEVYRLLAHRGRTVFPGGDNGSE